MIKRDTLTFFEHLAANNSKAWFDENRKRYEEAKANFIEVNQQIINGLAVLDDGIAQAQLEAKKTMTRINRDIRFSKDKSPYNTFFFSMMAKSGRKGPHVGYYLSIAYEGSFLGAGLYKPDGPTLNKVRQEIDYNLEEWEDIVNDRKLLTTFGEVQTTGRLTRPPKGFEKDNPALEWLKMKDYHVKCALSNEEVLSNDFAQKAVERLGHAKPLNEFINRVFEVD